MTIVTTCRDGCRYVKAKRNVTSVRAAMKPLERIHAVSPDTPVRTAMEIMAREDVNQLPVVSNGHLEGIVTRRPHSGDPAGSLGTAALT